MPQRERYLLVCTNRREAGHEKGCCAEKGADERKYSGQVLCMKPNFAILRLNNDSDKTGADYEAFICNGKAVYEYNGVAKTVTEWKLPDPKTNPAGATDNLMLDFLSGMKAKDAKERFVLSLFKEDENYV